MVPTPSIKTVFCILYPLTCVFSKSAILSAIIGGLFAGLLKNPYLCIVNEKRRNLRPAQPTKISLRAG